jgi:hypothetical protein
MQGLQHANAFVVQFGDRTNFGTGRVNGRAEHVVSGRILHFESLIELFAFVAHVMDDVHRTREASVIPETRR